MAVMLEAVDSQATAVKAAARVQALLDEIARRKVPLNYPALVESCKTIVLTRLLEAHGIVLAEGALSAQLMEMQERVLQDLLATAASRPKPPRLLLPRRV